MSLSKFFILCALRSKSMHGYDVAKVVESQSGGCCSPTEGAVYPILREFEEGGYATCKSETVSGRGRKVYTITDRGLEAFQIGLSAWLKIAKCLGKCDTSEKIQDKCKNDLCNIG
ncbi:PadR family transcriptional regulator [Candidatus Nesciobacter abundans]|uniref:PadR family transcriptional regulator n=2 Tax=Candidatus Nesciobacter abundans TaxID=2601668 RepID=A0A5C0UGW8_9PROT|nr:PadR family transcriptional regulator [Candidatus Nesciobacter abundans]